LLGFLQFRAGLKHFQGHVRSVHPHRFEPASRGFCWIFITENPQSVRAEQHDVVVGASLEVDDPKGRFRPSEAVLALGIK